MRTLRKGMQGDDVRRWQYFLRGEMSDCFVIVNGEFDEVTDFWTRAFQLKVKLNNDGWVGNMTMAAALKRGCAALDDETEDESGQNWPPPPNFGPLSYTDRPKVFGEFKFKPAPVKGMPEAIKITGDWVSKNITRFTIPQLKNVKGAPKSCRVWLHAKAGQQIVKVFQDWEDAGLSHLVLTWAGSWVPRYVRGSRKYLSNHSWGTAFDINVPWNGLGKVPALKGKKGSVRELVGIANENGLFWGGHYQNRKDGMHFEVAKVL